MARHGRALEARQQMHADLLKMLNDAEARKEAVGGET